MATSLPSARTPAPITGAAIELRNLTVQYGAARAVDNLSFSVPEGSIFGFLGPNGAGKTTTIKTLLGFRPPAAGSARVLGLDVVRDSLAVRSRVGYVSESNSLYDGLTIPQLLAFCHTTTPRWDADRVARHLRTFRLPATGRVGRLSKGIKSQLALCLALGGDPDVLILDEPTGGLDPLARHEFLNIIVREVAAAGKTLFFSSHILSEVEAVADQVAIIRAGRLLVCDELDHLKATQRLLKLAYSAPPPPGELAALRALPGVARLEAEGRGVRLLVRGDIEALTGILRSRPLAPRHLDNVPLNLESLFLEYMKDGAEADAEGGAPDGH